MLVKLTALILIPLLLSVGFSRCFVYVGFEVNKKFIALSLCENRNKPQLNCKGQCYFAKKIKQAQETEKSQEQQYKKNLSIEALIGQKPTLKKCIPKLIEVCFNKPFYLFPENSSPIFQPPKNLG